MSSIVKDLINIGVLEQTSTQSRNRTFAYKEYLEIGFNEVYFYPIIVDDFWIMSHEPMYINMNMPYANIFGHVHDNPIYKDFSKRSFCVCVERIGFRPILLSKIKEIVIGANNE